jgi:hypothetical protein
MNPQIKSQLDFINRKWSRPQNNRIPVVVKTGNDYGIQFWTPEMIKKGTAKNTDNTISTLAATAGWYQANESLKEIVRRVIKENDQDQYIEKIYWLLYPSANKYNKNTSAKDVIDFVKKNFKGDFKAAYNDLKSEDDFQSTRGRYAGYS